MTGMMILILVLGVVVISEVKSQGADLEQRRLYGTEEAICPRGYIPEEAIYPRRRPTPKCIRSKRRPTPGETQAADQVSTTVSPTTASGICECLETDGGCALAYDTLVSTIRTLSRQFYISFEFSAAKYVRGYQNVIDFTNQGFGYHWGSRIPIVDVLDNNQIITCFALNGYPNWCYTITKDLELDTWYTIEITQEKAITGKYFYQVSLNGDVQHSQVNTYPAQFNNVRVYGSQGGDNSNGDKYQRLDGNIRNLYINPVGPSEPNC